MPAKKRCVFLSFDYLDYDVFLNARIFYRLAGYLVEHSDDLASCDLLVIFRGIPSRIYPEYSGQIHFYDYVLEHHIDLSKYFPNASLITLISIQRHVSVGSYAQLVYGYLPVFPSLWQFALPFSKRSLIPIHVSNYKPLQSDHYQQQLISQIKSRKIRVYGGKWHSIHIDARPLSYLEANLKLSKAYYCYGLMYPYQRGKSLSGRMWQAPIQGCIVISEENTNIFYCPGIFEVSSFADVPHLSTLQPYDLAVQAASFWEEKTRELAQKLHLSLNWDRLPHEVFWARILMLAQHIEFVVDLYVMKKIAYCVARTRSTISLVVQKFLKLLS